MIHLKLGRCGREDMAHYLQEKQEDTGGQGGDNGSKNIQWSYEIHGKKNVFSPKTNGKLEMVHSKEQSTVQISLQSENFVIKLATACRMVRKLHFPERSR